MKSVIFVGCEVAHKLIAITERKDYVIDGKLVSTREITEDILIEDISQESVSI